MPNQPDRAVTIGTITFTDGIGGDLDQPPPQMIAAAVEICETFGQPIYPGSVVGAWLVSIEAAGRWEIGAALAAVRTAGLHGEEAL